MPRRRAVAVFALLVGALVAASPAAAAFTPKLSVTVSVEGTTSISYSQAETDEPAAVLTLFVASDYFSAVGGAQAGTTTGSVTAKVVSSELGAAPVTMTGSVVAAASATTVTIGGTTMTLDQAALACTGIDGSRQAAIWVLQLSGGGRTLQVPVFLTGVPTSSPFISFSTQTMQICLPPPDVAAGTPGRADFGAKLVGLSLSLDDIWTAPPGWYVWRLRATPYGAGTGKGNPAGMVEAQALDRTPQELSLTARRAGKSIAASGRLTAGGRGVPGVTVTISAGTKVVGSGKTAASGAFTATLPSGTSGKLVAKATAAPVSAGACQSPAFGVACTGRSVFGFTISSSPASIKK
jgi:hypothetical protein